MDIVLFNTKRKGKKKMKKENKRKTNFAGMYIKKGRRGATAVYQLREDRDCLSCELVDYHGETDHNKTWFKKFINLNFFQLLERLNDKYPKYNIKFIAVD